MPELQKDKQTSTEQTLLGKIQQIQMIICDFYTHKQAEMTAFGANTYPENKVKDKHHIFDAAQTPPRN